MYHDVMLNRFAYSNWKQSPVLFFLFVFALMFIVSPQVSLSHNKKTIDTYFQRIIIC